MKKVYLSLLLSILCIAGYAQTTYYNVANSTTLNSTGQWGTAPDGSGTNPGNFTTSGDVFNLVNGSSGTIGAAWALGAGVTLNVGDGIAAMDLTIPSTFALSGGSVNVTANGVLTLQNTTIPTFGVLDAASTVAYARTTGGQTVTSTTYGNLTLSNTSGTQSAAGNITVNGALTTTAGGTLAMSTNQLAGTPSSVTSNAAITTTNGSGTPIPSGYTWGGTVTYNSTAANQSIVAGTYNNLVVGATGTRTMTATGAINVNGNLTIGGATTITFADAGFTITVAGNLAGLGRHTGVGKITMTGSGTTISALNILGNLEINSAGTVSLAGSLSFNGTTTFTSGKLSIAGFTMTIPASASITGMSASNSIVGSLTAGTNISVTSTGSEGPIFFDQTTPGVTNNIVTFTCSGAAGTITLGNNVNISTSLNLSNASATIADGGNTITLDGTLAGTGRHSGAGKILMTGTNASTIAAISQTGNLELDKASGNFTLTGSPTVTGVLTFTNGQLAMGANTLTIGVNGSMVNNDTHPLISNGATSNFSVTATANIGTVYFDMSSPGVTNKLNNLTINGTGGTTTLGGDITVAGTLALTAGTLADGGNTLLLTGNLTSAAAGTHSGAGKILMQGAVLQTISSLGNVGNLELDNAAGFSLAGNTSFNSAVAFTSGKLALLTRTLTIATGASFTGLSAANSFTGGATSNLTVNTSGSTGNLFFDQTTPGTTDNIATFTNTLGTTTLGSDLSVSTTLTLTAGTLNDNGNTITVSGNVSGTNGAHSGSGKILMANGGGVRTIGATVGGLGNVELANALGFTLSANTIINGTLTFTNGTLGLLARTLTLGAAGSVAGMSAARYFVGSTTANMTINATSNIGTIYFDQTTPGTSNRVATFLMNGAGAMATLGSNMVTSTALTLTSGKLAIGSNTLTLNGTFTGSASNYLTGGAASNLTIGGTGALGSIFMDQTSDGTSNNIATLTQSRITAGTATLGNKMVSGTAMVLTSGLLALNGQHLELKGTFSGIAGTASLSGTTASTLTISGSGALGGNLIFDQTTPGTTNAVGTFTVDRTGEVAALGNAFVANTALNLTNGQLSLNGNSLTISGTFTGNSTNNLIGSATSMLVLNSASSFTLFTDMSTPGTSNAFSTLSKAGAGTVTINSDIAVGTTLTLTAGTLNDGGNTIALAGNLAGTGTHASTGSGKILFSGATPTMSGATVGNVDLNVTTVSLSGSPTVRGALTFTAGTLNLGANTLTIGVGGTVANMSAARYITGGNATSNFSVTATGDIGSIYFDPATPGTTNRITTFTMNGAGAVATLGNNLSVLTTLALTNGTLNDGGNTITSNANITGTGTHTSTGSGKISMTTAARSIAAVTLGNVELNNAGATSVSGNATITGALSFLSTATMSIAAGFTLTLNGTVSGMSATKYFTGSTTSNLTIGSAGVLGDIYMNTSSAANRTLATLTLNGGGSATMRTIAIINTALALTNGTLADGGNILSVTGNITGTGTHTSTTGGKITMTGTTRTISGATLGNLELNAATTYSLTGSPTVNGAFTFTSGTLTVGANTLTLNGTVAGMAVTRYLTGSASSNLTVTATGALGTLFFNPGTPGTTNNFATFTMNGVGGTATLGNALSTGTLALTAGTVAAVAQNIALAGNITGTGTHTSTTGSISMSTGGSTISGATLGNVTLNNATGFSLTGSPVMTGTLTLTAGSLTLGSNNVTLSNAVAGTPSASKMLITDGNGQVRKSMTANGSFTFPVGETANYTPMTLNVTGSGYASAYVGVNVKGIKHPSNANVTNFLSRYWTVTSSGITSPSWSVTTASYVDGDITGSEASMASAKYTGSLPFVKFPGSVTAAANTFNTTAITDAGADITVLTAASPSVSASPNATICNGGSTTIAAVSPTGDPVLTYTWAPATGLSATTGASVTASPTVTTTYTLTMTDGSNETATAQTTVTVSAAPGAAPANNGYICIGGTVNLSANPSGGTTTYLWSGANLGTSTLQNTTATPTVTGTYTLTVTDGTGNNGCSLDFTTSVNVNATPVAAPTGNSPICSGGTATLNANPAGGANTYAWSGANLASTTAQNPTATPTVTGTYSLTVSDGTSNPGCAPATEYTVAVTVNATPTAAPTNNSPICVGGTVTLTANPADGANTYSWSGPNLSSATVANPTATPTITSTYTLTVSDGTSNSGCAPATQYTTAVTVNPIPTLTSATNSGPVCAGVDLNLLANGPSNVTGYSWTGPNSFTSTVQNPTVSAATTAAGGTYTVAVNNGAGSGCTYTYTTTGTIYPTPAAITGTLTTCAGSTTTLANATAGGTWLSSDAGVATVGSATGIVSGISTGTSIITYKRTITGCQVTAEVTVSVSPAAITGTRTVCPGATTTLANAVPGGVWTSSNTAIATIGSSSGIVSGLVAGVATVTYAMGSGSGCRVTAVVTVNSLPGLITGTATVCEGSMTTLANGTAGGTWSTTDVTIATIGATNGVVSGVLAGNATVTYTLATGCYRTAVATVNTTPVAITGNTPVCAGSTITLANATGGGSWSWSGATVTVGTATGIVTGTTAGTATISYRLATGCKATTIVTVGAVPNAIGGTATVCAGAITSLTCTPGGGTWTSSDAGVATVGSSTGAVTGVSGGTAEITYTLSSGCFKTKIVTVNPNAAITGSTSLCVGAVITLANANSGGTWTSSVVSRATIGSATGIVTGVASGATVISYTLATGCKAGLTITVNPISAITGTATACEGLSTTLANATAGGSWSSSSDATATVGTATGIVTGVAAGVATITYMMPTGCFATRSVTINQFPAAIGGTFSICAGSVTTLTNAVSGGSWTSSSAAIATVGSATGILTGVAGGNATITYSGGPSCNVTQAVTVGAILPLTGTNSACVGMTTTLGAGTGGGTWASSDAGVATIGSATGVVSGISTGTATVTYTIPSGCFRTMTVSINAVPASIVGTASVCVSLTTTLNGDTPGGTWTSSNAGIATVGSGTGVVTGVAAGTATITYNAGFNCRVTRAVTVVASPAITGTAKACIGTTTTLSHSVPGGAWSTANAAVATVGAGDGVVTGIASGTTTITYAPPTGCMRTIIVTINVLPNANTGTHSICVGGTAVISNATAGGVSWSSSTPAVATIGAGSGLVTGVSVGTTTITYLMNTGCYAISVVTVNANPAAITGTGTVCVGLTTTLANATAGGTWTSSAVTQATVGAATGIVSGLSAGTSMITYSLSTGCRATTVATVQANAALTGTPSVCVGGTATLSSATTGGTWASSDAGTATVGTSNGVVTGVATGNATITYTTPTGCTRTVVATVNSTPGSITGALTVCPGTTTSLSNAVVGGTWSSSNVAIGSINSSTGVVTGIANGTANITYTVGATCKVTGVLTVNVLPSPITGTTLVCIGFNTTLASATVGGTWASSNTGIATVGTSGIVTGAGAGNATITYTATTGCYRTALVSVSALPAAITGVQQACPGTNTVLFNATSGGVSWTSSNLTVAYVGSISGVVTGVAVGTTNITYTTNTGCYSIAEVTINPNPAAITGPTNVCPGLTITLANATAGGTWSSLDIPIGAADGIATGVAGGVTTVTYTLPTGCIATRGVTVNPVAPITGLPNVCINSNAGLSSTVTGGTWSSSNPAVGTVGFASGSFRGISAGTTTVTYTTPGGCLVTTEQTVNAAPSAGIISGPSTVVVGVEITLSETVPVGYWSSANDGIAIVGSATGIVTGISAGNVAISYTANNGCGPVVATYTVNVTSSRPGNNSVQLAVVETSVFPNPNKGEFVVKGSLGVAEDMDAYIEISDVLGKVLYTENIRIHNGEIEHSVKLDKTLSSGTYTLRLGLPNDYKVFHFVVNQ
ncbi:MAG: hypothetical protein V4649_11610 [Bacteroidota bacterium]